MPGEHEHGRNDTGDGTATPTGVDPRPHAVRAVRHGGKIGHAAASKSFISTPHGDLHTCEVERANFQVRKARTPDEEFQDQPTHIRSYGAVVEAYDVVPCEPSHSERRFDEVGGSAQ